MALVYQHWLADICKQTESREQNIKILKDAVYFDEQRLRSLDATMKKVTTFTKKLKTINSASVAQLVPDLHRLNLSKYLDEIAANICDAKVKIADLDALVEFCVVVSSFYKEFPEHLLVEFRKQMPTKKGDKVENPSKLRVDLRFFAELLLNGVFERNGLQLLGAVIAFLVQTDKQEHANTSILLSFCRVHFFPITGILPFSVKKTLETEVKDATEEREKFISSVFSTEQRNILSKTLNDYWQSLLEHTLKQHAELNKLRKSIRRQERTRGDASADDRQRFEQAKQRFERLHQSAVELGECLGQAAPEIPPEEASDDEREVAFRLSAELSEGRVLLWPDRDSQLFYESLMDVTAYTPTAAAQAADAAVTVLEQQAKEKQLINESIDNVDLSCLEEEHPPIAENDQAVVDSLEEDEGGLASEPLDEQQIEALRRPHTSSPMTVGGSEPSAATATTSFLELLQRMPHSINRELIDALAIDFLKQYARNKSNRKQLVKHFLQVPDGRLELLPFYARFLATIQPAYPEITMQVLHELLARFRAITQANFVIPKKDEIQKALARIEAKLHLCAYLAELCKFGILPKAEALTCLRSLLVQVPYKVDMLCVMIEQMGPFLYRSPDAHSKMTVIMQVLKEKSENVKDPRQKILLENAYFTVIPPDDQTLATMTAISRPPPMHEFLMHQLAKDIRIGIFRRIDWDNKELRDFTINLLSHPWRVQFSELARLASLVSALSDHHDWIGIRVLDAVLEFVRLSLEVNAPALQQRALAMFAYFGQLFNYNVTNTSTLFKVLYQLISLGIHSTVLSNSEETSPEHLIVRLQRIRLVTHLVDVVCEFFSIPKTKSKRRMDHFLCFFLRFYHETRENWSRFIDELGEFPEDVEQLVKELLLNWRKNEAFPTSLIGANKRVEEIELFFKSKVDEILKGMRNAAEEATREATDADEQRRRLNRIAEEDEDEEEQKRVPEALEGDDESEDEEELESDARASDDEDDENGEKNGRHRSYRKQESGVDDPELLEHSPEGDIEEKEGREELLDACYYDGDDSQQIRVHTQQQQLLPEDEDFMRDFERIMNDSLQSAPVMLQGPISDLVVPPQAKQKFERKLTFAISENQSPTSSPHDLLPPIEEGRKNDALCKQQLQMEKAFSLQHSPQAQPLMALMLRAPSGKGGGGGGGAGAAAKSNVLLKAVKIVDAENLTEKWRIAHEEQERKRREMKKVTLALNERMAQEADEAHRQQQISELERRVVFTTPSTLNYGGRGGNIS